MHGTQRRGRSAALATATSGGNESEMNSQFSQLNVGTASSVDNDDGESECEEYGDMHRLVLQGIMAAGYLNASGVRRLFEESCKQVNCKVPSAEHTATPFLQKIVREINEKIKSFDMVIKSATCEVTGEKFYMFLVAVEKQVMKLQTYFSKVELDLFQKILDSILRKHLHFTIPMFECINILADLDAKNFNKSNAEDFVMKMIELQYFTKVSLSGSNSEFEVTLGFRTIREFEPIFRDSYSDVFTNCCLCTTILLNGLQCPKCPAVMHRGCSKKYILKCKNCPSCKGKWKNKSVLMIRTRDGVGVPQYDSIGMKPLSQATSVKSQTKNTPLLLSGDEKDMPVLKSMASPSQTVGTSQRSSKVSPESNKNKNTPSQSKSSSKKKDQPPAKKVRRVLRRFADSDSD